MKTRINFGDCGLYFMIEDPITQKFYDALEPMILEKSKEIGELLHESLRKLIETNNDVDTALGDNEYSAQFFKTLFIHAEMVQIDIAPIVLEICKHFDLINKYTFHFNELITESEELSSNEIIGYWTNVSDNIDLVTWKEIAIKVSQGAKTIDVIHGVFKRFIEEFPEYQTQTSDLASTIRTLVNYGGTLTSAKALISKYMDKQANGI